MDSLGCRRSVLMMGLDRVQSMAQKMAKRQSMGQLSFMDLMPAARETCSVGGLGISLEGEEPDEFPEEEKLSQEKESFGFYLFGHPLSPYHREIQRMRYARMVDCRDITAGAKVQLAVIITGLKKIVTRKGDRMAFGRIEDMTGSGEVVIFPSVFAEAKTLLEENVPLLLEGTLDKDQDQGEDNAPGAIKIRAESFARLSDALEAGNEPVELEISLECLDGRWDELVGLLRGYPGRSPVLLGVRAGDVFCRLQLGERWRVGPSPAFWKEFECLTGHKDV
jgi:DNA polymerase-3 subunit alpha